MIFEFLFWISVFALIHTYIFFPFLLKILSVKKKENTIAYSFNSDLPFVSIIMAVHNEEQVLVEKINSIFYTYYPIRKFEIIVGSDASTDGTNRILNVFSNNYNRFYVKEFMFRMGKPEIINQIVKHAHGEILLFTDANVFFHDSTLFEVVKHFKNPEIGLVDTKMVHRDVSGRGISFPENTYLKREVKIKEMESKIWGTMMGPFGGCFAIRKNLFVPIPENFITDDFFLNMSVLSGKHKTVISSNAIVSEDVTVNIFEEFWRKIRIASGNFQNLVRFSHLLWPPFNPVSFCFFSHKVLRWLGPFFIIIAFVSCILLKENLLYNYLLLIQMCVFLVPLIDFLMTKLNINIVILRFISHFLLMNLAIIVGFIRYISGIKTNIWQPTRRNQESNS